MSLGSPTFRSTSPPPAGPTLKAISVTPASITAGSNGTGTVSFTGAMNDGAVVTLTSSNPAVVQVPQEMVVNQGESQWDVPGADRIGEPADHGHPDRDLGRAGRRRRRCGLSPGAPPAADRVAIKKAQWKAPGTLTIEATSTNPNAILTVYSSSGSFMFDLKNNGGGRYSDQRQWRPNPGRIQVKSNFGGICDGKPLVLVADLVEFGGRPLRLPLIA